MRHETVKEKKERNFREKLRTRDWWKAKAEAMDEIFQRNDASFVMYKGQIVLPDLSDDNMNDLIADIQKDMRDKILIKEKEGLFLMAAAIIRNDRELLLNLIEKQYININLPKFHNHNTPLELSLFFNRKDIMALLLEKGASYINAETQNALTHMAVKNYHINALTILNILILLGNVDLNKQDKQGNTVLHLLLLKEAPEKEPVKVTKKRLRFVEYLISCGARADILNQAGDSALHIALRNGFFDEAKLLIPKAMVNQKTAWGYTALQIAAGMEMIEAERLEASGQLIPMIIAFEQIEIIKMLFKYQADPNNITRRGDSLIHFAIEKKHFDFLLLGIDHKINLNLQDAKGNTPLHHALTDEDFTIAMWLKKQGARIDIQNHDGKLPVHIIYCSPTLTNHFWRDEDFLPYLESTTYAGLTPLDLAFACQNFFGVEKLKSLGVGIKPSQNLPSLPMLALYGVNMGHSGSPTLSRTRSISAQYETSTHNKKSPR